MKHRINRAESGNKEGAAPICHYLPQAAKLTCSVICRQFGKTPDTGEKAVMDLMDKQCGTGMSDADFAAWLVWVVVIVALAAMLAVIWLACL